MLLGISLGLGTFIHRFHVWRWWTKEDDIAGLLGALTGNDAEAFMAINAIRIVRVDQHRDLISLAEQPPSVSIHLLPFPFGRLTVLFGVEIMLCRYFPSSHVGLLVLPNPYGRLEGCTA